MSIVLGLKSATLAEAAGELVPKALQGTGRAFLRSAEIAGALKGGLTGAVELRRGLALLHAHVDELQERRASMGISAGGLAVGGAAPARVFVVALFLRSARQAGYDVPPWARQKLSDERTVYKLRTAPDLDAVMRILRSI